MSKKIVLQIEVQTKDGKIYRQPFCRIKTDPQGNIMALIKETETSSWQGVKAIVRFKNYVPKKHSWFTKLFSK